jgi:hypothetical protein
MFKENGARILSAAGVEFRHLHFPHNERSLVLRSRLSNWNVKTSGRFTLCAGKIEKVSKAASFNQYVGIDYSGAQTPTSSLSGLRIYLAGPNGEPLEILPPPSARKYWTRRGIAKWLVDVLVKRGPTLVGIDHGFSFSLEYFEENDVAFEPNDWTAFLEDFQKHWPTDEDNMYVDFIRDSQIP